MLPIATIGNKMHRKMNDFLTNKINEKKEICLFHQQKI